MRNAQRIAELCFALSAASGATAAEPGSPVSRDGAPDGAHWARLTLAARAATIGGGTTDIQLNIIAERMLGLPRDPEPPAK
jgi:alkylation response protein AidB-like acyl-CoA dehydrogenase